jgi:putative PIG3 family NAD(P)H quinone oxidoreductase
MRAVVISKPGGPEVLEIRDVPQPSPGANEVLIRVHATAINRADLLQREGRYPAPTGVPQDIPGMEYAGEVVSSGPSASLWQRGQRVFGIVGGGSYAEYVLTHESTCMEIPANLSWSEAASIPEVFITAHDALWSQAGLRANETVLIHAVGSGVGIAALQLARARSAIPFGTSRTKDKLEAVRGFGMEEGLHLSGTDLEHPLKEFSQRVTDGRGFDVVLDLVGGPYVQASVGVLAAKGRIMLVGTVGGQTAELILGQVLAKRARLIGTVLRARPLEEKITVAEAFVREVVPLFARRNLRTSIDQEFPFTTEGVRAAHKRVGSNESMGKVVLRMDGKSRLG